MTTCADWKAELEAENAKQKSDHAAEAKWWEAEFNQQDSQLALVHSCLDALGVPACDVCPKCNGTKLDPAWTCHVCPVCHGGDTVDRLTARLDWVAERLKAWDTLSQDAKDEATQWVRVKLKDVGEVPPMPYDGVDYDRIDPEVGL